MVKTVLRIKIRIKMRSFKLGFVLLWCYAYSLPHLDGDGASSWVAPVNNREGKENIEEDNTVQGITQVDNTNSENNEDDSIQRRITFQTYGNFSALDGFYYQDDDDVDEEEEGDY